MAYDVAIVGAGAAGIAAGRRLADRGHSVLLIDALDRLGGRAWTIRAQDLPLDLGCGWLHTAERNPWVTVAEAAGFAIDRSVAAWTDQYRNLGFTAAEQKAAGEAFAAFNRRLAEDPPASDLARDALPEDPTWHCYLESMSSYLNGAGLAQLSVADYVAYDRASSERNWRVPEGYGTLIAGEAKRLPTSVDTHVAAIDLDGSGVRLATDKGAIAARAAIVTVPTDILAKGAIRLPGAFDGVCDAASRLPLGLADKLFLALADPDSVPPESHLLGSPHRARTGSYYMRPFGRPVIECFLGGATARALEAEGGQAAVALAREELGALLGADFARGLTPIVASAWARVPSIGGSYSHALPGHADARKAFSLPIDERIAFAGEACSPTDFSTAHGAYATGIAAAERIEATLTTRG
jgi:monoamine oxidase